MTRARKGPTVTIPVWHSVACAECGERWDVHEADVTALVRAQGRACRCQARDKNNETTWLHPPTDVAGHEVRPILCGSCGYAKKFGWPPAGQEDDDMAKGKKSPTSKTNGASETRNAKGRKGFGASVAEHVLKADPSAPIERRRFKQKLPCPLPADEAAKRGHELAIVCREFEEWRESRKLANIKAREERTYFEERIAELRVEAEFSTVSRDVECVESLIPSLKAIRVIRMDTGQVIEDRPARSDELQTGLFGEDLGKLAEAAAKAITDKANKAKGKASEPEPPFGESPGDLMAAQTGDDDGELGL